MISFDRQSHLRPQPAATQTWMVACDLANELGLAGIPSPDVWEKTNRIITDQTSRIVHECVSKIVGESTAQSQQRLGRLEEHAAMSRRSLANIEAQVTLMSSMLNTVAIPQHPKPLSPHHLGSAITQTQDLMDCKDATVIQCTVPCREPACFQDRETETAETWGGREGEGAQRRGGEQEFISVPEMLGKRGGEGHAPRMSGDIVSNIQGLSAGNGNLSSARSPAVGSEGQGRMEIILPSIKQDVPQIETESRLQARRRNVLALPASSYLVQGSLFFPESAGKVHPHLHPTDTSTNSTFLSGSETNGLQHYTFPSNSANRGTNGGDLNLDVPVEMSQKQEDSQQQTAEGFASWLESGFVL